MWIEGNYRRIFLDAHIDDWNEEFLSKVNPEEIVSTIKLSGAQNVVVKAKPHTGLCYWPCSVGRMHKGLRGRDYVGEMIELCHQNEMSVIVYYSQIFDNWAYENHPAWRCVYADGKTSKEKASTFFKKGRYGVVCANNKAYREYVRANLQELNRNYSFEGMFLDMPFWPEVCYCHSCTERYLEETGKEMPKIVDWSDPDWLAFQYARERWMGEFAAFSTSSIKEINPHVTVEHNFAVALFPWQFANTDLVVDACDYAGGDYYGGYLQQTFCCKYYKSVSPNLPFVYITSRCDPDLSYHTTTKTKEELLLHAVTALVHNGAFSLCDGLNPDGTITPEVYRDVMKEVFDKTRRYEKVVSGEMLSDVAVWVSTHSKFTWRDNGKPVSEQLFKVDDFIEGQVKMASILREYNVPFDIVASRNLKTIKDNILVISDVAVIRDDEMDAIESYLQNGGNLYLSGQIGHRRLLELLEAEVIGLTEHNVTYMNPTNKGKPVLEGFSQKNPLTVDGKQLMIKLSGSCEVLATITLPYTLTEGQRFSAIHSNPPGIDTDLPAIIVKSVGKGKIVWLAAPIEKSRPFMSKRVVYNLLNSVCREWKFTSNAPSFVEILGWEKEGKRYLAAINQQESSPISPIYDLYIELSEDIETAVLLDNNQVLTIGHSEGKSRIFLPRLDIFHVIEFE
ncbi:hypothetical protein Back11_44160 [Paenibacillus baekrokdamisoli]|uniref:Uncharacterized protein n=1 Tax=Paenibacillus baekrokdamisoli TaxID=1712516 RepID=A0A3G9JB12_9BACL|nr:alpha-L-fucosidase [Paenibacillus baekrokdamisoli]MBB3067882.1 hypothetical protein [Paenibacillus baekrokdamisoli]BBH23071.1 hypothetical protein Back11_44160 [Paenibacillus baekrokdamisoli]